MRLRALNRYRKLINLFVESLLISVDVFFSVRDTAEVEKNHNPQHITQNLEQ
jgi:hypothetical protein